MPPACSLDLPFPCIMGVVNVTPDSFSDGGRFLAADAALEQSLALVREGAAIVDIGGESTRPGSDPVRQDEELRRVMPVVEALAERVGVPISVDTTKAEVARRTLAAGAAIVNDVTALRGDPGMADAVAEAGCPICLMHMQGQPKTMQEEPHYEDVVLEVLEFLETRMAFALVARRPRGADTARPGPRLRQDGRAQPHPAAPPRPLRGARATRRARRLAQTLPRRHPGC